MIPPYTYAAARLAEERRADVWREDELTRLIRKAKPAEIGFWERAIAAFGRRLTVLGEQLQAEHSPQRADTQGLSLRGSH